MSLSMSPISQKSTIDRFLTHHRQQSASRERRSRPRRPPVGLRLLRTAFAVGGRWLPGAAARLGERLFLTPPRHAAPARERVWLASARRFTVEMDDGRHLAAWSWGEGPPVLLVHGWGGRGGQLGAFVEPLVGAGLQPVTFDAPGHGQSVGRRSSLPEMAAAVRAMTAFLGPLAGLVAHSAGAGATTWALRSGIRVERLVYVAPGVDPGDFVASFGGALAMPKSVQKGLQRRIEGRFGVSFRELSGLAAAPSMTAPLLVLHDRFDDETSLTRSRELVRSWPGARLEVTSGLGHRRILRDPEVVRQAVDFLRRSRDRSLDLELHALGQG